MKKVNSGGNLGSQKYEARRNMELFHAAVNHAKPSRETAAWRAPTKKFYKRIDGRKIMKEKIQQMENEELGKKIYDIHNEPRRQATREYVPGWRIGNISGGMCIDCYATDNPLVKVFARLHNYKEKRKADDKRIARDDAELRRNIAMYTSDLSPAAHRKQYEYNRYRARFFFNKENATVLHLGLNKGVMEKKKPYSAGDTCATQDVAPGLGLNVNTYTGSNPTAALRPPSPSGMYRGSTLCYSVRPDATSSSPAKLDPSTALLSDRDGNVLGHLDDEVENDRLLLRSASSLRPRSANPAHVSGVRALREAVRIARPGSAPAVPRSKTNVPVATHVYSQEEWELFIGAMEVDAAAPSFPAQQIGSPRLQRQLDAGTAVSPGNTRTRALTGVGQPRPNSASGQASRSHVEPWRNSPVKEVQRPADVHIYDGELVRQRLGASDPSSAASAQKAEERTTQQSAAVQKDTRCAKAPFLLREAAGLDAFSKVGTRRLMFDRLRAAQAAAEKLK